MDEDHLNLLAVFHFLGAGFALLGILFLFVHFAFVHFIFTNPAMWADQKGGPPPAALFGIFMFMYIIVGGWLLISLILNALSGFFLLERKCRMFSLVVAGVDCLHVPLGTVLGVFTIVVLSRESVRRLYEGMV